MSENASQHEANKLLRVLKGERLKYTVRLNLPDGKCIEFQADKPPELKFDNEDRNVWLMTPYPSTPIMRWIEGSIMLLEENKS